uniref:Uncharacterized protein n=1 Tax=Octopus bimaculoides TaxID=37653 RepID=A0A0L8IF45_OCTBM
MYIERERKGRQQRNVLLFFSLCCLVSFSFHSNLKLRSLLYRLNDNQLDLKHMDLKIYN